MNKILTTITFLMVSSVLLADDHHGNTTSINNDSTSESWSGAGAGAKAEAYSDGQNIKGSYNTNVAAPALGDAVGQAIAPALTTTLTETCMGSTSVGAGFSGGSFSFGTTWRDTACVRRLDARQIQSMGDNQLAKEIMCDSDLVRAAAKRVGRPCVEDGGSYATLVKAPTPMVNGAKDKQNLHDQEVLKKADEARAAMKARGL